ncbi:uncharacterized protein LOC132187768 [Corylus avellana]|uniref:uncharacterized protein LOC132187768 n=1 Tax=Corylus avellana TaxID=13451 RepID=UPI001E1EE5CF|nr:uncharacterized protein LOC132187768 [Corylus avellana]
MAEPNPEPTVSPKDEKDVKAPNIIERAKEEIDAITHTEKSPEHHKETHGRSDDIDENTPIDEVKGPSVFERVKEEIEAIVEAIHPKKESKSQEP